MYDIRFVIWGFVDKTFLKKSTTAVTSITSVTLVFTKQTRGAFMTTSLAPTNPSHWPEAMDDTANITFVCAACGAPLTNAITQLPSAPEKPYTDAVEGVPSIGAGFWAIDPLPRHAKVYDGDYSDPDNPFRDGSHEQLVMNSPLLNPVDLLDLQEHPDPRRNYGCCRRAGDNGPNLVRPSCGAEVATASDDCHTYYEVRLLPSAVSTVPAQ